MSNIIHIPLFFIFLPYIGLSIFPSDIQPFAVFLSLLSSIYLLLKKRAETRIHIIVIPTLIMLVVATISFFIQIIFGSQNELIILLRIFYGYFTPPIIIIYTWLLLKNYSHKKITHILDFVLIITFFGFILNVINADFITNFFVNRNIQDDVIGGARGFVSFYPEQSRISEQMGIIFFMYLIIKRLNVMRLLFIFTSIILSFSGQSFIVITQIVISFFLAYLLSLILKKKLKFNIVLRVIFIIALVIFAPTLINVFYNIVVDFNLPSRGIGAINKIFNAGLHSVSNDKGIIIKASGVILTFSSIITNPLNFNLATIPNQIDTKSAELFFSIQKFVHGNSIIILPTRIYSSVGSWIIEFGLIGLIMTMTLFIILFKDIKKTKGNNIVIIASVIFLTLILFIKIPQSNPTSWSFMMFILYLSRLNNFQNSKNMQTY